MPHMVYLLKRHRCDLVYVRTHSHMSVPPKWEHILCAQLLPTREVQVPPKREPTILSVQILVQGLVFSLNREPLFFLWSNLVNPNLTGSVTLTQLTVISCNHKYRLSILQWNPGTPPILPRRPVGSSMRLFYRKPVIMSHTSPISSLRTLATRTSPSCSTRILSSPTLWFSPSKKTPQAKVRGVWFYSSFEACCDALLFLVHRRLHFCSVHIHNVVAKKRDASTDLPRRLHGYMKQHNVDFIGGDFKMSAFCTVGDVFSDTEFSAPANSFLWGLGALEEPIRERTGFLIMPKRPYDWRVDTHGCYKFDNAALGFGPRDQTAHLPVFLHLRTTNLPSPNSIMRSEQPQQRRFERRHNKHERMWRRRT